ncbi:MAG TPA: hypothetical protein PKI36_08595, partial [Turneriella sp.]|nr:hypothetical protein [Turneriella sp.]
SSFSGISADSDGNLYACGYQSGSSTFSYGAGVTAQSPYAGGNNAILVKYGAGGSAVWAQSTVTSTNSSKFNAVTTDTAGNIYVGGDFMGTATMTFGASASVSGVYFGTNTLALKYAPTGTALWARSVTAGGTVTIYDGISAISDTAVIGVGRQFGGATYTYGPSVSVSGPYTGGSNALIVKYE